jgi:hypothetical protein
MTKTNPPPMIHAMPWAHRLLHIVYWASVPLK